MIAAAPVEWLVAILLGALLALDGASVGQFMLSRPIAACTLAGALVGSPAHGVAVGVVMEALHLAVLPVGAARYPEGGPASVAAASVFAWSGGGYPALLVVVLFAVGWEHLGSWSVSRLRVWNAGRVAPEGTPPSLARLERLHFGSIAVDALRGAALTAAGLAVAAVALAQASRLALDADAARLATGFAAALGLAASLRLFGTRRLRWFAAGAVVAAATLWGRG